VRYPIEKFSPNHITLQNCSFDVKKTDRGTEIPFYVVKKGNCHWQEKMLHLPFQIFIFYTDDTQQY
jgi:hypothetical protein